MVNVSPSKRSPPIGRRGTLFGMPRGLSPYRIAPPRPLARASGRRWPTWLLDLVGAVVTLAGWPWARWAHGKAAEHERVREHEVAMDETFGRMRACRAARRAPCIDPNPTRLITAADLDAALTGAPPRVATGQVEVPASLDVVAMVEASTAKWGTATDAAVDDEPWPFWRPMSPGTARRMAGEMAKHLRKDGE